MTNANITKPSEFSPTGYAYNQLFANSDEERARLLATNSALPKDAWERISDIVVDVPQKRLNGIADLQDEGLTSDADLAFQNDVWHTASEMTDANVDMGMETEGEEDGSNLDYDGVPLPIVHKDFRFNFREIRAASQLGRSLPMDEASRATRQVVEAHENILFNGWSGSVNGYTLYGYTDEPNRNQYSGSTWGTAGNIADDVNAMIEKAEADSYFGPYNLYVSNAQWKDMRADDPDSDTGRLVRDAITDNYSREISNVKATDKLPDGEAVLVQMDRDVVELAMASDVQTVEWSERGETEFYGKVMASMIPKVKSDQSGGSGVVHATGL